jgi:hypothetical protein
MILTRLGPEAPFYRALPPRWAYQPESGAGAAVVGGRFNRPGVDARYLAQTPAGALLEYQQESTLLPPATVATYLVSAEVVDFTGGYTPEDWSPIWAGSVLQLERPGVSREPRAAKLGHRGSGARGLDRRDPLSLDSRPRAHLPRALSRVRG